MVQPSQASGGQATSGTRPRLVIYLNLFRLHTANEEEESAPPFELARSDVAAGFSLRKMAGKTRNLKVAATCRVKQQLGTVLLA